MEIPNKLNSLYRHWGLHTKRPPRAEKSKTIDLVLLEQIIQFVTERMHIWECKQSKSPTPWTKDPILQQYRFCNIYRELDRQTIEIHEHLLPIRDEFDLWLLNIMFHRFVCRPDTVKHVGLLSFDEKHNQKVFDRLMSHPRPKYGTAYVFPVSIIQRTEWNTREKFFCFTLPDLSKVISDYLKRSENLSPLEFMKTACDLTGYNFRFHFTEIAIDIAYQFPLLINLFDDIYIGPGAIPTLKRLSPDEPNKILQYLSSLQLKDFSYLEFNGKPIQLSNENWEGIACEFRKYSNLELEKGRKRRYNSKY